MVISVNNQIGLDCEEWIKALRSERNLLTDQRGSLQSLVSSGQVPHDDLPAVDHFENQFEIQLTNINHLKHAIKEHLHVLESTPATQLSAPHLTVHESLSDQVQGLLSTINKLKQEFSSFYLSKSGQ